MSEQVKTHWRKTRNMTYLGSWDLESETKDLVLTIKSVGQEEVHDPVKNETKTELVAHFYEVTKPMVLNATNCKAISKVANSPYMEDWPGTPIAIYVENVKAFGDIFPALRIRKKKPDVRVFKCDECGNVIVGIGGKSASDLVEISKRNCGGKALCVACQKKFKAEMDKKAVKEEKPEPEPVNEEKTEPVTETKADSDDEW